MLLHILWNGHETYLLSSGKIFWMNRKSNIVEVADKLSDISEGQIFLEMVGKSELAFIKYQPCARHY